MAIEIEKVKAVTVADLIAELQRENPTHHVAYMYVTYERSVKQRLLSLLGLVK